MMQLFDARPLVIALTLIITTIQQDRKTRQCTPVGNFYPTMTSNR